MIDTVQLSPEEIVLLRSHFRKSQKGLIRERAQAVISSHQGFSPYQISQVLLRSEKTIRGWIICIIWDNARFHKGKKIKAKLSTTLKSIHLINLPAYAPDHNPQEHVWKYGKDKIANVQCESLEEVVQKFSLIVMGRKYPYHF